MISYGFALTDAELSMTKDKTGKSSRRRRKSKKSDCVVFSDNWSMVDKYAQHGTPVAMSDEGDSTVFKALLKKLTQQKEARI